MEKIYETRSSEFVAKEKGITVQELFKNEGLYFNFRGRLSLSEFPNAIFGLDYTSINGGIITEINGSRPQKEIGKFKRIKWVEEEGLHEGDTWKIIVDIDLIENRDKHIDVTEDLELA